MFTTGITGFSRILSQDTEGGGERGKRVGGRRMRRILKVVERVEKRREIDEGGLLSRRGFLAPELLLLFPLRNFFKLKKIVSLLAWPKLKKKEKKKKRKRKRKQQLR